MVITKNCDPEKLYGIRSPKTLAQLTDSDLADVVYYDFVADPFENFKSYGNLKVTVYNGTYPNQGTVSWRSNTGYQMFLNNRQTTYQTTWAAFLNDSTAQDYYLQNAIKQGIQNNGGHLYVVATTFANDQNVEIPELTEAFKNCVMAYFTEKEG